MYSHFKTVLCCETPDLFNVAGTRFVLLKATCSPNPNTRTSGPDLANHLVLPHEHIHPLNLLHLIFFYNIIIIIIFIDIHTYKHNGFTLLKVYTAQNYNLYEKIYQYAFGQKLFSCLIADLKSKF